MSASAANLALLRTVAVRLGPLPERVVFLGGATIALLITDADGIDIRATNDVDVIVEVSSYFDDQHTLRNELLNAGFREIRAKAPRPVGGSSMASRSMSCLRTRRSSASAIAGTRRRSDTPNLSSCLGPRTSRFG